MGLKTEWVRYGEGQKRLGYLCVPEGVTRPLPAVLVLQEALGVDEHIEDVTRRFAQAGADVAQPLRGRRRGIDVEGREDI